MLTVRDLRKSFGATAALAGSSLEVLPGEVHALVGENGAGKSTMIKVLAGAIHADSGEIHWLGNPYRPANPADARRHGIATCYQELAVVPHLTVAENILLGQELSWGGWVRSRASRQRAAAVLESLDQSRISPDARVGGLPLSAQQFVEIARAVASDARLIILDEPTSALTQSDAESLFALVRRLREQGISFLYVSHFLEEIMRLCDRYTVMNDGRTVGTGQVSDVTMDDLIAMMVGRRVEDLYPHVPHQAGDVVLDVSGLRGADGKPSGTDFRVRAGEIIGIGGLVGSGRTELLRCIYGLNAASAGDIRMSTSPDENLRHATVAKRLRRGIAFASEDRKTEGLALRLSLAENIGMSALGRVARKGWLAPRRLRSMARESANTLDAVYRNIAQPVMDLSGGNQQKIALARLLFSEARVLLLDEPTRGIDVGSKAVIYRWLGEEAARGRAVVITSSYIPELLGVCDVIGVMFRGRLVAIGPRKAWSEEKILLGATTGVNPIEEALR